MHVHVARVRNSDSARNGAREERSLRGQLDSTSLRGPEETQLASPYTPGRPLSPAPCFENTLEARWRMPVASVAEAAGLVGLDAHAAVDGVGGEVRVQVLPVRVLIRG